MAKKNKGVPQYVMPQSEYDQLDCEITGGMNFNHRAGWARWTEDWFRMVRFYIRNKSRRDAFYSIAGKVSNEVKREIAASREEKSGQQYFKF